MVWKSTITGDGLALMQAWIAGDGILSITGAKGGTEAVAKSQMVSQTDVSGDSHKLVLLSCEQEAVSTDTLLRVMVRVLPEIKAYTMHQIGLYAKLVNDGEDVTDETLLALYQLENGNGMSVPTSYSPHNFRYELEMVLHVGAGNTATLQLDPSAYVSEDDLDETLDALHPNQLRIVEKLYTYSGYGRYNIGEWKSPGTTWVAGRARYGVTGQTKEFTAPDDKYACAIKAAVTEDSVVMEAWLESDEGYESAKAAPSSSGSQSSGSTSGGSWDDEEEIPIEDPVIEYPGIISDDSAGNGIVTAPIEYETLDGWIFLTSAEIPSGDISVGFIIMK